MPNLITNEYGEQIQPGKGEGTFWHTLPDEDKIEDIEDILSGKRSFGKTDNVIKMYYELMGQDSTKTVQALSEAMILGKIPAFKMWESPNTSLEKYQK